MCLQLSLKPRVKTSVLTFRGRYRRYFRWQWLPAVLTDPPQSRARLEKKGADAPSEREIGKSNDGVSIAQVPLDLLASRGKELSPRASIPSTAAAGGGPGFGRLLAEPLPLVPPTRYRSRGRQRTPPLTVSGWELAPTVVCPCWHCGAVGGVHECVDDVLVCVTPISLSTTNPTAPAMPIAATSTTAAVNGIIPFRLLTRWLWAGRPTVRSFIVVRPPVRPIFRGTGRAEIP